MMDATRRAILEHHEHFDGSGNQFDPETASLTIADISRH
jgi:HD-GYP domain-containing protein (c-di-GMP phosphodiesterase class II)